MARRQKKSTRAGGSGVSRTKLSPVMQLGVVFVIVAAMLLLMYAAKVTP